MDQTKKDRLEGLALKGWVHLTKEEKEEYSGLKKELVESQSPTEEAPVETEEVPVKTEETVEIKKSQLDGIMARLNQLESGKIEREEGLYDSKWKKVDENAANKKATLRCLDGKYAIDLKFSRNDFNTKTQEKDVFYNVTWLTESGEEEVTEMLLKDFINNVPRQEVEISDKRSEKLEMNTGKKTMIVDVDYSNFKSKSAGNTDMTVTMDKVTYTVHLPDDRKFPLDASKLNM